MATAEPALLEIKNTGNKGGRTGCQQCDPSDISPKNARDSDVYSTHRRHPQTEPNVATYLEPLTASPPMRLR